MKNLYIHQHSRLGDMILCNALIRILSKKFNNYRLNIFCRSKHIKLVKFMYRDNKKIRLIPLMEDPELKNEKLLNKYEGKFIENYLRLKNIKEKDTITIGFENYHKTKNLNPDKKRPWPCDIVFYKQFNIPFKKRFTETYWKRNKKNEKKLYNKLIQKNEKYIFVHDDPNRNIYINKKFFNKNIKKIIRNNIKENIFNYSYLLENATEIHIMESSIRQIIEVLKIKTKKLYLYKGRGGEHDIDLYNTKLKKFVGTSKKWQTIKNGVVSKKSNIYNKVQGKINLTKQKFIYSRSIKGLI